MDSVGAGTGLARVLGSRARLAEQRGRRSILGARAGEADPRLDGHGASLGHHRGCQRFNHPLGDQLGLARMQHFGQEQRELVAAEPGSSVGPAQALVEPAGDLDEHGVPGGVAVLGVDAPEVLEIDGDDAHDMALRVAFEEGSLHAVDEEDAVGELRERIVEGSISSSP